MVFKRKEEMSHNIPLPHQALRNALISTGKSWGQLGKETGYTAAYLCMIANGKKKLNPKSMAKLQNVLPNIGQLAGLCPTCGQTLPQKDK